MRTKSDIIAYLSAKYLFEQKIAEISNQVSSNTVTPLINNDKSFFSLLTIDKLTELLESLKNVQEKEQTLNNETSASESAVQSSAEQPIETANTEVVLDKTAVKKALEKGLINEVLAAFILSRSPLQLDNMVNVCNNQNLSQDELMAELLLAATTGERDLTADQLKETIKHLENEDLYNFFKNLQPSQESEVAEKEQPAAKVAPQPEPESVKIEQQEPAVEQRNLIYDEISNMINFIANNDPPQPQPTQSQQPQATVTSESTYTSITPRPTAAPGA
jgi:hypothetical protein